jgi:hypothetical protein
MWGLRRSVAVLATVVALASGCGLEQQHGYVQSDDGSLSFRYPVEWSEVELDPVASEWVTGIDASSQPSDGNRNTFQLDQPFVVAQVYPLDEAYRDGTTLASLRLLALADQRDPAAGDDPSIRVRFHNQIVDEEGFEGHHIRFEIDVGDGTAVEEQIAVFDPARTRIHRVRVACSLDCFEANTDHIDEVFDSLRLRQ